MSKHQAPLAKHATELEVLMERVSPRSKPREFFNCPSLNAEISVDFCLQEQMLKMTHESVDKYITRPTGRYPTQSSGEPGSTRAEFTAHINYIQSASSLPAVPSQDCWL